MNVNENTDALVCIFNHKINLKNVYLRRDVFIKNVYCNDQSVLRILYSIVAVFSVTTNTALVGGVLCVYPFAACACAIAICDGIGFVG